MKSKRRDLEFGPQELGVNSTYHRWIDRFDVLRPDDLDSIRSHAESVDLAPPLVILRFDQHSESRLHQALEGLQAQVLEKWQAVLHFDPSCSTHTSAIARDRTYNDPRISVLAASDALLLPILDSASSVVFACGAVRLREHALYMLALAASGRETALVYSDEDQLDANGKRASPIFKPDFSPELFQSEPYLGSCVLLRAPPSLLRSAAAGFLMRFLDILSLVDNLVHRIAPEDVIHVPHVLFHDTGTPCPRKPRQRRRSSDASAPCISIIIPTRDRLDLLRPCLNSIDTHTDYPRRLYEVVIVDNGSRDPETLNFLAASAETGAIRLIHDPGEFNFSRINNLAAAQCRSDILLFLNNDTVVIDPQWLRRLATYAIQPDIGAVGCKLLYADGTVQHGGMVVGIRGSAVHAHVGLSRDDPGFQGLAKLTREVAAVTGACMATRRNLFLEVGGFDEQLPVAFNDTDFCLRVLSLGYRNIFISDALAIHHECKTRGRDDTPAKISAFRRESTITRERHARLYKRDPYYNPNLSVDSLYGLAFPPRRTKPWRTQRSSRATLNILCLPPMQSSHPVSRTVIAQVARLLSMGHQVSLSRPTDDADSALLDCTQVVIATPDEAAIFAVQSDVDCIIVYDAALFSVALLIGDWPKVICCDYGELPDEMFDDVRQDLEEERTLSFSMSHGIIAAPEPQDEYAHAVRSTEWLEQLPTLVDALCVRGTECFPLDTRPSQRSLRLSVNTVAAGSLRSNVADRRRFYAKLRNLDGDALVDQLYLSVLGRYADPYGRKVYVEQLSSGISKERVIWDVANSEEARRRSVDPADVMLAAGLSNLAKEMAEGCSNDSNSRILTSIPDVPALLRLDGQEFVHAVYATVLGRAPDTEGLCHYAEQLRSGTSKIEIISRIRYSPEGRKRGVQLKGYRMGQLWRRLANLLWIAKQ